MSTDPRAPYLSTVRAWMDDLITPLLPSDWRIIPHLSDTVESLTTVVYITFRRIDNATDLGVDAAVAEMVIEVTPPKTNTDDDADDGVVRLIAALHHEKVMWASAEKKRDPGGPLAWEITVRVITSLPTDDTPTEQ